MIKKRLVEFINIWRHKKAFIKVRNSNKALKDNISLYRCIMHDLGKSFNVLILGDKLATKIHRKLARHHNIKTLKDKYEAFCDWECARYTKPDKPLNAKGTWKKYYFYLDMGEVFDNWNKYCKK